MSDERNLPDDALGFIKRCVLESRLLWTYHVNMRMRNRFIPRQVILEAADSYEIIEAYPDDKYLPSYLVYARHGSTVFHVLFAADVENQNVRVVTVYHPNPEKWGDDLRSRRS